MSHLGASLRRRFLTNRPQNILEDHLRGSPAKRRGPAGRGGPRQTGPETVDFARLGAEIPPGVQPHALEPVPVKRNLLSLASLMVLAFAGWQMFGTMSRTPAFNRSLLVEAATGDRTLRNTDAMFDRAEYYYWIALEWSHRTFAASLPGEEGSAMRNEALEGRSHRVRDSATESLRHSPGAPLAWMLVAKAEAALGNRERALEAYLNSPDLAPHSALRAADRMYFLARFMSEPEGRALALSTIAPKSVHTDLRAMQMKSTFGTLAEQLLKNPAIAAFEGE